MINRYSLADHLVKVTLPANIQYQGADLGGMVLQFGGPGNNNNNGSFMGSITVARSTNTWSTTGDATGSWVHNKTLDRTGTVSLDLRQVSDDVIRLQMLANIFETQEVQEGCRIEVYSGNVTVAVADDCYITKIPNQVYGDSAANQTWEWTSGKVTFPATTSWPKERV